VAKNGFRQKPLAPRSRFQLGDAIFRVGAPVVIAPDLLRRISAGSGEDPESVARHVDQLAASAVAALTHSFAIDHDSTLNAPTKQFQPKLARRVSSRIVPCSTLGAARFTQEVSLAITM
jgi:hypothetical protein